MRDCGWRHSVDENGGTSTFASCVGEAPSCIVNRLGHLTIPGTPGWDERDDDYARAEFRALLISWLSSLGRKVIDRPGGNSLAGADGGEWHDRRAALACGLPLHPFFWASRSKYAPWPGSSPFATEGARPVEEAAEALVVGTRVFGSPKGFEEACLRLAGELGCDTLAILFAKASGGWSILGCERAPVVAEGEGLDALFDLALARSE